MNQHLPFFTFQRLSETVNSRWMVELLYVIEALLVQGSGVVQAFLSPVHGGYERRHVYALRWIAWVLNFPRVVSCWFGNGGKEAVCMATAMLGGD